MMETKKKESDDDASTASTASSLDEVAASLAEIESNLDPGAGGASMMTSGRGGGLGRARWTSLGTALRDIRGRLASSRHSLDCQRLPEISPAPDALGAADPSDNNRSNSRIHQLYERLSIAERAHSTRTPLNVMQSEWSRRNLSTAAQGTEGGPSASRNNVASRISQSLSRPGSPTVRRGRSQLVASRTNSSNHFMLSGNNRHHIEVETVLEEIDEDGGSSRRTHRSSTPTPIKKKRKDDDDDIEGKALEDMSDDFNENESRLHRQLSTVRIMTEEQKSVMSIDTGAGAVVATQSSEDEVEGVDGKMDIEVVLDDSRPETSILLSDDLSEQLDSTHRSVLFRASSQGSVGCDSMLSSMQLDDPAVLASGGDESNIAATESTLHLPQVYSWGTITTSYITGADSARTSSSTAPTNAAVCGSTSGVLLENSLYDTDESGDPNDLEPIGPSSRIGRTNIVTASTSCNHTAAVTSAGSLLTCGNNSYGAVDPTKWQQNQSNLQIPKPTLLERITVPVLQVSCGLRHTAAVTATGTVLTWGSNDMGQLGHRRALSSSSIPDNTKPQMPQIMALGQRRAASVNCGNDCTMVLTTRMQVVIAGHLVLPPQTPPGSSSTPASTTKLIPELFGLPITKIAVGAHHAIVMTCHGTAFAWGDNSFGQCGQEHPKELHVPVPMKIATANTTKTLVAGGGPPLPSSPEFVISGVACGQQHSILLARNGKLWVCGDNSHGQLGLKQQESATPMDIDDHGSRRSSRAPPSTATNCYSLKSVVHPCADAGGEFMAAVAGQYHSLVLDTDQNVWQFGNTESSASSDLGGMECVLRDRSIIGIAAGGNHSIAVSEMPKESIPPALPAPASLVANTTPTSSIATQPKRVSQLLMAGDVADRDGWMQHSVEDLVVAVGRSPDSSTAMAAETVAPAAPPSLLSETAVKELANRAEELLQSPSVLNGLFLDPLELDKLYIKVLGATPDNTSRQLIAAAMEKGMMQGLQSSFGGLLPDSSSPMKPKRSISGGDDAAMTMARIKFPESVRFLLLYLQNPLFSYRDKGHDADNVITFDRRGDLTLALCEAFLGLSYEGYRAMVSWVTTLYSSREVFVRCLVQPLLTQLERGLAPNAGPLQRVVPQVVAVLQWLYVTSERAGGIAKPEDFWSPAVGRVDPEHAFKDLRRWKKSSKQQRATHFFLCSHAFLFSPATKRNLLAIENEMGMLTMAAEHGGVSINVEEQTIELKDPFYVVEIDRSEMLKQTLQILKGAKATDLRKKLKVVFKGEDGVDAGGVTREFFQLLCEQLFDVNSGMWTDKYEGDGGETDIITWFNSDCFWNDEGYYLVGILVGLAVYNSVLLDVHFPPAVYRKLLGLPLGLEDMVDARLRQSLQQLLDYEGDDVEDLFCLTFSLSWMDLGSERIIELKPGGEELPVTSDNKEEYVRLYVKWLLEESIHPQYDAFERGFMQVMEHSTLDFMSPQELELLVVGSPELDFDALEANTTYEGFDKDDPVIHHLWSWLKNCDSEETRLQFLRFATGSAKAPIGGLGKLPFKIQKNGDLKQQLPSSHTCFNTLLLPDYGDDYDLVAERLGRAVLECEGFGLE